MVNGFTFTTRREGMMGPSADDDLTPGAICWHADAGTGVFDGASGIIISSFTVRGRNEIVDHQWRVIFLGLHAIGGLVAMMFEHRGPPRGRRWQGGVATRGRGRAA